jgi:hypothetical protein
MQDDTVAALHCCTISYSLQVRRGFMVDNKPKETFEMYSFDLLGECPHCHERHRRRFWYFNEGKRIAFARFYAIYLAQTASLDGKGNLAARSRLHVECPACRRSWAVFSTGEVHGDWICTSVEDTDRSSEVIGEDVRRVTNGLSTESPRGFKFSQQWTSTLTLETTETKSSSLGAKMGAIQETVTASVQRRYGITVGESRTTEEEFTVVIPPKTTVSVKLVWRRIWQHGVAHMVHPSGKTVDAPFRVAVDLTFDQELEETSAG